MNEILQCDVLLLYMLLKVFQPLVFPFLIVVGKFISPKDDVVNVTLGEPFVYNCPPHEYSYGVVFSWGNSDSNGRHTFARNDRRSISSNGTLYITSLTKEDINEIESYKGIRCIITGANSFQESGTLRLQKIDKVQTGKRK